MVKYLVRVIKFGSKEVVKEIDCSNMSKAKKVEKGLQIYLNYEQYYTEIVPNASRE